MILIASTILYGPLRIIRETYYEIMFITNKGKDELPTELILLSINCPNEKLKKYFQNHTDEQIIKLHPPKKRFFAIYCRVIELLKNNCAVINNTKDCKSNFTRLQQSPIPKIKILLPYCDDFSSFINKIDKQFKPDYYSLLSDERLPNSTLNTTLIKHDSLAAATNFNFFELDEYKTYFFEETDWNKYDEFRRSLPLNQKNDDIPSIELYKNSPGLNQSIKYFIFDNHHGLIDLLYRSSTLNAAEKLNILNEIIYDILALHYSIIKPGKSLPRMARDIKIYFEYMDLRNKGIKVDIIEENFKDKYKLKEYEFSNIIDDKFPQFKKYFGNILLGIWSGKDGKMDKNSYSEYRSQAYRLYYFLNEEEIMKDEEMEIQDLDLDTIKLVLKEDIKDSLFQLVMNNYPAFGKLISNDNIIREHPIVIDLGVYNYMQVKSTYKAVKASNEIHLLYNYIYLKRHNSPKIYEILSKTFGSSISAIKSIVSMKLTIPAKFAGVESIKISSIFNNEYIPKDLISINKRKKSRPL